MRVNDTVQVRGSPGGWRAHGVEHQRARASMGARMKALLLTFLLIATTLGVGWLVWSVMEWRKGRTVSYRLMGLRVVRRSDGKPIGLLRSFGRNAVLCTILLIPTMVACCLAAVSFVMGASAPDGLLRQPRTAPWDYLSQTEVICEPRSIRRNLRLGRDWPASPLEAVNLQ